VSQIDSNQEEKSSTGRFHQEVHPNKSGMDPIEEQVKASFYQEVPNKKNAVGPIPTKKDDDYMAAMLLPDPGQHDNRVYAGFNHCYGTCCLWMYCPCNVICPSDAEDSGSSIRISEGYLGILTELGRFHSMMKPGAYYINRMAFEFTRVDMRTQTFRISIFFLNSLSRSEVQIPIER
jgi:hypothetical protein